jgi:hypothetical protein
MTSPPASPIRNVRVEVAAALLLVVAVAAAAAAAVNARSEGVTFGVESVVCITDTIEAEASSLEAVDVDGDGAVVVSVAAVGDAASGEVGSTSMVLLWMER